jgi:hypothetical protein
MDASLPSHRWGVSPVALIRKFSMENSEVMNFLGFVLGGLVIGALVGGIVAAVLIEVRFGQSAWMHVDRNAAVQSWMYLGATVGAIGGGVISSKSS